MVIVIIFFVKIRDSFCDYMKGYLVFLRSLECIFM